MTKEQYILTEENITLLYLYLGDEAREVRG